MEMPINVIVVLFVAVAVGGAIIFFAQRNLTQAQQEINARLDDDGVADKDIIIVDDVTADNLVGLAQECVKRHRGGAEDAVCFAVFADAWPSWGDVDGVALADGYTIDVPETPDGRSALISIQQRDMLVVIG